MRISYFSLVGYHFCPLAYTVGLQGAGVQCCGCSLPWIQRNNRRVSQDTDESETRPLLRQKMGETDLRNYELSQLQAEVEQEREVK